ncbi:MAG: cytochrome c biogenesis protein CcdA [Spirochaetaceae bacterium]|jgi:cytochrome c-type biogenesis protein|nr:cytochrome c biogenesis protein CcdA [Spirochaetaceae bacterium]
MNNTVSVGVSFVAGLLSFCSPCVLPLIPSYLAFLGGSVPSSPKPGARFRLAALTTSFILGFGAVFTVLSILFSGVMIFFGGAVLFINIISGIVVIMLGLNGLLEFLPFLNYEKRLRLSKRPRSLVEGFLAGAAFGAGWSPCVGPILTGILLLAGQSGALFDAALCLVFYTAGLGLPFLAASVLLDRFFVLTGKLKTRLPLLQKISGVLLIVIGVLIISGRYQALGAFFARSGYAL